MKATGTEMASPARSVAMRRPGCTAGLGSLMRPDRWAAVASMSATVNARPQKRAGSGAAGLGRSHELEDGLAHPEESLQVPGAGLAGAAGRDAGSLQRGRRAVEVGGHDDQVVDVA